jgi:hypothetical protein
MTDLIVKSQSVTSTTQEEYFLKTFPLIRQIIARKLSPCHFAEAEDIAQEVKLGLLTWKTNRSDRTLSYDEWCRIANTATQNEIKSFYKKKSNQLFLMESIDDEKPEILDNQNLQATSAEGDSQMELHSLLTQICKFLQTLSPSELYAVLFKKQELISLLIGYRVFGFREMAELLKLTRAELEQIVEKLPLSDTQIVSLLESAHQLKVSTQSLRKIRERSLVKLQTALASRSRHDSYKIRQQDGKTPDTRKNQAIHTK